jgi:hypothetical protein
MMHLNFLTVTLFYLQIFVQDNAPQSYNSLYRRNMQLMFNLKLVVPAT